MIRWLLVIFVALVLFSGLHRWLEKIGLGRLPGDFRFRIGKRNFHLPLASSVVIAMIGMLIAKVF